MEPPPVARNLSLSSNAFPKLSQRLSAPMGTICLGSKLPGRSLLRKRSEILLDKNGRCLQTE